MPITLKTPAEVDKMRVAGRLAAQVLDMIGAHVQAGVTTERLNQICHDFIVGEQRATPAPLNYRGFPKSICTSVNHVVCHGIPSERRLKHGDIINIDITVIKDGFHGDTSRMFFVGDVSVRARRVCQISRECLHRAIALVKPGARLGDLGHAIQRHAEGNGFSVVREYCGHGIGRGFHEDPQVLHYGKPGTGLALQAGMTFTIEPMLNAGRRETRLLPDNWTVITKDRSLSAQWEHTILVTDNGHEILTRGDGDSGDGDSDGDGDSIGDGDGGDGDGDGDGDGGGAGDSGDGGDGDGDSIDAGDGGDGAGDSTDNNPKNPAD